MTHKNYRFTEQRRKMMLFTVAAWQRAQVLISILFLSVILLVAIPVSGQETGAVISPVGRPEHGKGYAIVPFTDTLFSLYDRAGSFPPGERAAAVTKRIQKLADDYYFVNGSLRLVQQERSTDIVYGEATILSVSDVDALTMHYPRQRLATLYRNRIANAVEAYKEANSFSALLKRVALTLLVLVILFFILWMINKLFRLIRQRIERQEGKRINGIRFRKYTFIGAGDHTRLLIRLNGFIRLSVTALVLFFSLPLVFGLFPPTERLAGMLIGFVKAPFIQVLQSIWDYLPRLATIIVIITIFHYILRCLKFLKREIETGALKLPGFHPDWANLTYQVIRVLIYAFVLVLIFPYLPGSGSPVFNGVSIFLGALLTFGSSSSLGNIVAGLALTYMRAFKDGDRVKIGEVTGDIVEKNLLVTRVRTIKNEVISIPNANVLNNPTINFSKDAPDRGLILHTIITIGYDVHWKTVHELAVRAALATRFIESEPTPFVYQTSLDDFYVSYQVNAYTRYPNHQASTYSELYQHILDQFNEAGIEILSPHYRALRDGHTMAAPAANLPEGYTAPALRVSVEQDILSKKIN